jgi:hypothetical protein
MKEQFDKRLTEKIKDSFENHEEPFDPRAWESFSAAYFKPKKATSKFDWILWAASIALVLGLTFLFLPKDSNVTENRIASNQAEMELEAEDMQESVSQDVDEVNQQDNSVSIQLAGKSRLDISGSGEENSGENKQKGIDYFVKNDMEEKQNIAEISTVTSEEVSITIGIEKEREMIAPFVSELRIEEEKQAVEIVQAWLNDGKDYEKDKTTLAKDVKNPVKLGVLVSPQTISNSNQAMNLGAGFMSEFSFSKRLKLDLGMAYASQNISPDGAYLKNAVASQTEDASRLVSMSNNLINTNSELKFGQLEIPINLKFMVMDKKASGLYLVSGVSNMVYVNQRSVNTFNAVNLNTSGFLTSQNMVQTFTETVRPSEENSGSNVGQMINFGLGYEHSLKNGTFVSFEPFFKTSVGSQTFLGQQFSIGGMNIRMNFQLKK